jgi:hypothetical protein
MQEAGLLGGFKRRRKIKIPSRENLFIKSFMRGGVGNPNLLIT